MAEDLIIHWGNLYNILYFFQDYSMFMVQDQEPQHIWCHVWSILSTKLSNNPFTIVGTGKQTRDFRSMLQM